MQRQRHRKRPPEHLSEVESMTQRSRLMPRTLKNARPKTDFSKTYPFETKNRNGLGHGQGPSTQATAKDYQHNFSKIMVGKFSNYF